jgi:hypothetical protein
MNLARVFTAAAACVVLGAALAACSGSFGSGSGLPQTLGTVAPGNPTPSPTPNSTSVILTVGESTAFQPIPEIGGYTAQLAFPKVAPEPAKAPSGKGSDKATPAAAPTPVAVSIGATLSIMKPADGPDLNFESGKGRKKRTRDHPARALAYITLLPTHDVTLESFPRIILDVPREIASQYRDGEFGLALWNSGEKDAKYRLAVAELDKSATPPPSVARAVAAVAPAASGSPAAGTVTPSPAPSSSATTVVRGAPPGMSGTAPVTGPNAPGGAAGAVPGGAVPSAAPTLPPAHILFAGTAAQLKLVANRPAVFAVYALPHPATASAAPAASAAAASHSAAATRATSPMPNASGSPAAASEMSATSAPATAASPSPTNAPTKAP